MAVIISIVFVALLAGLFFLFRATGTMVRRPSARERVRHTTHDHHTPGPRATGLN